MNFRYRDEMIILIAIVFALLALGYKHLSHKRAEEEHNKMLQESVMLRKTVLLRHRWGDVHHIEKGLEEIHAAFPKECNNWHRKGRKLSAACNGLSSTKLGTLTTRLLDTAIQIEHIKIERHQAVYRMEFVCKW